MVMKKGDDAGVRGEDERERLEDVIEVGKN